MAAALGVVSPSILIITIIAMCLSGFKDNVYVRHALAAISVCVVALILDAVLGMWKKGVKDGWGLAIFLVALGVSMFTKLSPVLLVIAAAAAGLVIRSVGRAKKAGEEAGK